MGRWGGAGGWVKPGSLIPSSTGCDCLRNPTRAGGPTGPPSGRIAAVLRCGTAPRRVCGELRPRGSPQFPRLGPHRRSAARRFGAACAAGGGAPHRPPRVRVSPHLAQRGSTASRTPGRCQQCASQAIAALTRPPPPPPPCAAAHRAPRALQHRPFAPTATARLRSVAARWYHSPPYCVLSESSEHRPCSTERSLSSGPYFTQFITFAQNWTAILQTQNRPTVLNCVDCR